MNELILLCAGAAGDPAPDDAGLVPPASTALQGLLARGAVVRDERIAGDPVPELPDERWLRDWFRLPASACLEALSGVRHGLSPPWWRLTPCHLHLGLDHAILVDPGQLDLTADEADALARSAAPLFDEVGLALRWPDPAGWFALGDPWALRAWPWTLASGRNVIAWQPSGDAARAWRRLLTGVQMGWHDHPTNLARAARGARPVNALWLDGFVTELPAGPTTVARGTLITGSPALAGLATCAGWTVREPDAPAPATHGADAGGGPLIVDIDLWRASRRLGDTHAWQQAWADFDHWLQGPSFAAARASAPGRLRVVLGAERRLVEIVAPAVAAWRFWHRFDPMAAIGARSGGRADARRPR
jgi:hypothetical protein